MIFISFSIKDISDYRTELMGWAIQWIMMLHFTFTQIKPLGFIAQYRFACVEIFPFVSGFELFNSLDKADSILFFYRKRLSRIFTTYYLILGECTSLFLFGEYLLTFLFRISTIVLQTKDMYWSCYIPYIQTIGWAPNIEQDTRNYSFLSPISKDYLSIIDWLSYKHHFAFKIIPTIVASHWRDSITHFNHKEFEVCYNKKMLLHFLLNIHNFPDSCFIDEVHFKRLQLC